MGKTLNLEYTRQQGWKGQIYSQIEMEILMTSRNLQVLAYVYSKLYLHDKNDQCAVEDLGLDGDHWTEWETYTSKLVNASILHSETSQMN